MKPEFLGFLLCLLVSNNISSLILKDNCTEGEKKFFSCNTSDLTYFTAGSVSISCKEEFCNYNYEKEKDTSCKPCLSKDDVCGTLFRCANDTHFTIGSPPSGPHYWCGTGYICNENKETNCDICIEEQCQENTWKCSTSDKTKFTLNGLEGQCFPGYICKQKIQPPCNNPCMKGISEPTISTETTETSSSATKTDPQITTTTQEPTTTINTETPPSEIPPTTTESTTVSTTVSALPPYELPNCNDGHGDTNPCRPGPPKKPYYYRCKYYSPVWYDYEMRLCSTLFLDPICQDKVCF